jgi:endonuclease G, mitochondrial
MKKLVVILVLFICSAFSQDVDTVTIFHKHYSSTFSKSKHFPVVVTYWLTKKMLDCDARVKRTNKFATDPKLPGYTNLKNDYTRSGYDRGHNMPAEDNRCDSEGMKECFYYSNMTPQTHSLNAGAWKTLEEQERAEAMQYDSVLVWCGSVAGSEKVGRVSVPEYCWKVIFVKSEGRTEAYSFRNDRSASKPLKSYKVSVDSAEHLSGIIFPQTN